MGDFWIYASAMKKTTAGARLRAATTPKNT
jgi:hypothetical protein